MTIAIGSGYLASGYIDIRQPNSPKAAGGMSVRANIFGDVCRSPITRCVAIGGIVLSLIQESIHPAGKESRDGMMVFVVSDSCRDESPHPREEDCVSSNREPNPIVTSGKQISALYWEGRASRTE